MGGWWSGGGGARLLTFSLFFLNPADSFHRRRHTSSLAVRPLSLFLSNTPPPGPSLLTRRGFPQEGGGSRGDPDVSEPGSDVRR